MTEVEAQAKEVRDTAEYLTIMMNKFDKSQGQFSSLGAASGLWAIAAAGHRIAAALEKKNG